MDRRRAQVGLAFCVLALTIAGSGARASYDDSAIVKHLRPSQLSYLIVADRRGHPHTVAAHLIAQPAALTYVPTRSLPKPTASPAPPVEVHDLVWMFAHRFDEPATTNDAVPGKPTRSQVGSPFDINSGGFHGVRAVNGFSAERVAVSIPCGVSHFFGPIDEETGYIYIGGWGAGPHGVSVDAGLQKSSAQSSSDDYAFYWKYASNKPITSDMRFPCGGPDVVMELYPVSPTMLVFDITGVNAEGKRVTITLVQKTTPKDGWIPSGGSRSDGIILKRIVAIAQPLDWKHNSAHRNRFVDGSYFGINGPSDRTPRIVFGSCQVGRLTPPAKTPVYQTWSLADTWSAASPGMYLDWPPLGISRATLGACDAAGIYLHAI